MRRNLVLLYVSAVLFVGCNRNEASAPPQTGTTGSTTTVAAPPQDLSKAKINTVVAVDNTGAVSKVRVGGEADAAGLVSADKTSFKKNEPILVSMWLNQSPDGLQTSAQLLEKDGQKVISEQRHPMKGEKTVTFRFTDKLKPGDYKVKAFWGGNTAGEYTVTVK